MTNPNPTHRFPPGNEFGGAKPGAGRKPVAFKRKLADLLFNKVAENADGEELTAVDQAWQVLIDTMHDDSDKKLRFMAAEKVFEYAFGKPRQTLELQHRTNQVLELLDAAEAAEIQRITQEAQ